MSYHSEEVWESFEALWQRVQTISRRMGELEMKIRVLEQSGAGSDEDRSVSQIHYSEEIPSAGK
ncbi:MAG TPA: hypothetical protein VNO70_10230 [Blastocatellia bacterium]|nr:hypothetical protein [Blastocatellia bacterium]